MPDLLPTTDGTESSAVRRERYERTSSFLGEVAQMACRYIGDEFQARGESPVLEFRQPAKLKRTLCDLLNVEQADPVDVKKLECDCELVLQYCVRTGTLLSSWVQIFVDFRIQNSSYFEESLSFPFKEV